MKKAILLVLLAFLGSILFADPFGLKMGMTLEEIAEKCGGKEPIYTGFGTNYKIDPIKKNDAFAEYDVSVHDDFFEGWKRGKSHTYRFSVKIEIYKITGEFYEKD